MSAYIVAQTLGVDYAQVFGRVMIQHMVPPIFFLQGHFFAVSESKPETPLGQMWLLYPDQSVAEKHNTSVWWSAHGERSVFDDVDE